MNYYLINQKINEKIKSSFTLPIDISPASLKEIIEMVVGQVSVFIVYEHNQKKDLSAEYGRKFFDYKELIFETKRVRKAKMTFKVNRNVYWGNTAKFYVDGNKTHASIKQITVGNEVWTITISHTFETKDLNKSDLFPNIKNKTTGNEYEKFIGSKYEEAGYQVEYRGMESGIKDGGIDIIAIKDEVTTFVQCKNWINDSKHVIDHKDIRAFIGDCLHT